jgi:NADPH:quinone reductase-like Zn-dependent oxidoreductase
LSPFVGQKLRSFISSENHRDVLALKELIESHQVTPVVDRTFALSQAQEAIEYLETGEAAGKVVITV